MDGVWPVSYTHLVHELVVVTVMIEVLVGTTFDTYVFQFLTDVETTFQDVYKRQVSCPQFMVSRSRTVMAARFSLTVAGSLSGKKRCV